MKPTRPVPRGCEAGKFRGRYKVEPQDFVVEEVPAYEPCGEGDHVWLWIEKPCLLDAKMEILRDATWLSDTEVHFIAQGVLRPKKLAHKLLEPKPSIAFQPGFS